MRKADIRPLFSDHVAVVDNSGVEDMKAKYEAEKSRRIQVPNDPTTGLMERLTWI